MREINSHVFSGKNTREAGFLGEARRYFKLDHAVHRHYLTASLRVFEFMIPASCFSPRIMVSDRLASPPRLCLCLLAAHGSFLVGPFLFKTLDTFSRQPNVVLTHICWFQLKPTVCPAGHFCWKSHRDPGEAFQEGPFSRFMKGFIANSWACSSVTC